MTFQGFHNALPAWRALWEGKMGPCRRGNPKLSDSLSPLHHSDTAKAPAETEPCRAQFGATRAIQEAPDALQRWLLYSWTHWKLLVPPKPMESCSHHTAMGAPCSRGAGECQSLRWMSRADYTTSCVICTAVIMHSAETSGLPVKWLIVLWWISQFHSALGSAELSLGTPWATAASQLLFRDWRNSLIPPPSNLSHPAYSKCSSLSCPGVPDLNEQHFVQNLSSKSFRFLRIWKKCHCNELIILNKRNKCFLLLLPLLKASLCVGLWENCLHQQLLIYFLLEFLDMQIHTQCWSHRITN